MWWITTKNRWRQAIYCGIIPKNFWNIQLKQQSCLYVYMYKCMSVDVVLRYASFPSLQPENNKKTDEKYHAQR